MVDEQQATEAGRTAGIFAGMVGGARLGQMALPVPYLGTLVGGVVGGVVGSELGQRLALAVVNGSTAFVSTLTKPGVPAE
jgi:phage tail tape-measure protein